MPHLNEMLPSKYLKQSDIGEGKLVTIKSVSKENVGKDDDPEYKWTASFTELEKPLVLNSTNLNRIARTCGSENSDDWMGKQIVLYVDPDIEFGGKVVGGIRVRAPKNQASDLPF